MSLSLVALAVTAPALTITPTTVVCALMGLLAGVIEARLLRRAATGEVLLGLPLRLAVVGGVLVIAALLGGLLAAVLGWALALALSVVALAWRWT